MPAKREKNKNLRIFLFSIIGFCCLIVGAFLVLKHFRDLKQYTYTEEYPLYQYFAGNKEVYNGKVTLSSDDDITKIESNGVVKDIEDAPIYFQNVENEVLTGKNMLLVFPRLNNKNYKMKMFSKVVYENDSNAAFYYLGNQKIYLEDSFLYDGNDLYLFLYPSSLSYEILTESIPVTSEISMTYSLFFSDFSIYKSLRMPSTSSK